MPLFQNPCSPVDACCLHEELLQHGSDGIRGDIVGLTCQGAALRMWEYVCNCLRCVAHPHGASSTVDHDRGYLDGSHALGRQRVVVSHDGGIVDERVRHSLHPWPKWRVAHL